MFTTNSVGAHTSGPAPDASDDIMDLQQPNARFNIEEDDTQSDPYTSRMAKFFENDQRSITPCMATNNRACSLDIMYIPPSNETFVNVEEDTQCHSLNKVSDIKRKTNNHLIDV